MIARLWHGWTTPGDADAYEALLRNEVLPGIVSREIPGYLGAHVLRRERPDDVEFVTLLWFRHLDAVRAFAGEEHARSVVPPAARELLVRFEEEAHHYEVVREPGGG